MRSIMTFYIKNCTFLYYFIQYFFKNIKATLPFITVPGQLVQRHLVQGRLIQGCLVQGGFFDWSPQKSLSIEILYENT